MIDGGTATRSKLIDRELQHAQSLIDGGKAGTTEPGTRRNCWPDGARFSRETGHRGSGTRVYGFLRKHEHLLQHAENQDPITHRHTATHEVLYNAQEHRPITSPPRRKAREAIEVARGRGVVEHGRGGLIHKARWERLVGSPWVVNFVLDYIRPDLGRTHTP